MCLCFNHSTFLQYPFEALFRSEQFALVDNSCREFLFICEFFMMGGSAALEFFDQVMGKTLSLLIVSLISLFANLNIVLYCNLSFCFPRKILKPIPKIVMIL